MTDTARSGDRLSVTHHAPRTYSSPAEAVWPALGLLLGGGKQDPGDERIAVAAVAGLQRAAQGEVRRGGAALHQHIAPAADGNAPALIVTRSAEIGRVQQGAAVGAELRHKGVLVAVQRILDRLI